MKKIYISLLIIYTLLFVNYGKAQTEVKFYTTMGNFMVELYDSIVPITAGNFDSLVRAKYYDGIIFHRVIDNFMIQGGDPTGTGYGGPGYSIPDEFDSSLSNIQKTISMANSGPNTGGSQFFINLVNNTYLDFDKTPYASAHPVFGIVTDSFSVVQAIGKVATNGAARPLTDVVMDSIRVIFKTFISDNQGHLSAQVNVYPNPITEESIISINMKNQGNVNISVYDQLGRLRFFNNKYLHVGKNYLKAGSIFTAKLIPGIYNLILTDGKSFPVYYWVALQ